MSEKIDVEINGNKKRKIVVEKKDLYDRLNGAFGKSGDCLFCGEKKENVGLLQDCSCFFEGIFEKPIDSCLSCPSVKSLLNIRTLLKNRKQYAYLCRACCLQAEEKANEKIRVDNWDKIREEKNAALSRIEDLEEQLKGFDDLKKKIVELEKKLDVKGDYLIQQIAETFKNECSLIKSKELDRTLINICKVKLEDEWMTYKGTILGRMAGVLMGRKRNRGVSPDAIKKQRLLCLFGIAIFQKISSLTNLTLLQYSTSIHLECLDIGPTAMRILNHVGITSSPSALRDLFEREEKKGYLKRIGLPKETEFVLCCVADNIQKILKTSRFTQDKALVESANNVFTNIAWFMTKTMHRGLNVELSKKDIEKVKDDFFLKDTGVFHSWVKKEFDKLHSEIKKEREDVVRAFHEISSQRNCKRCSVCFREYSNQTQKCQDCDIELPSVATIAEMEKEFLKEYINANSIRKRKGRKKKHAILTKSVEEKEENKP